MSSIKRIKIKQAAAEVGEFIPCFIVWTTGGSNCVYVNSVAQVILREQYGIESKLVHGSFGLATSASGDDILAFGNVTAHSEELGGGAMKAHAWLECQGVVMDFSWRYFPYVVSGYTDWVWSLDTDYYCGKRNSHRNTETIRHRPGRCYYIPFPDAEQAAHRVASRQSVEREGYDAIAEGVSGRWVDWLAHWKVPAHRASLPAILHDAILQGMAGVQQEVDELNQDALACNSDRVRS